MMLNYWPILFFIILFSCGEGQNNESQQAINKSIHNFQDSIRTKSSNTQLSQRYPIDSLEQRLLDAGLINIQSLIHDILTDVRYSTENNFMHEDVYGSLNRIYLQPSVAYDLKRCQEKLKSIDSTLTLYVFDGVRPRSVQQTMWDILDMPIWEKTKFVSNPKNGSLHNYGAAVDLTIADSTGQPIDMGAEYDDVRTIAYPKYEKVYLDSGVLDSTQIANRVLLRTVMRAGGFWGIQTEWWHFNRYNRDKARELFEIIE